MKVWLLYDGEDRIEGVYTEAAKEAREEQFYQEALINRDHRNDRLIEEIKELKEMRQPYLDEANMLLDSEQAAKEEGNTCLLKMIKKQRKVDIRQADRLTSEISRRETKIRNSQILMKKEIIATYGTSHWWDEYYVIGED